MKTRLLTGMVTFALTSAVLAQGTFVLDNSSSPNGFAVNQAGNWFTGGGGIEVWEANAATAAQVAAINSASSGVSAYSLLLGFGFKLEATISSPFLFQDGTVALGDPILMRDVYPQGATVTVSLVAWNTSDTSASVAIANATGGTRLGVLAFSQPTGIVYVNPSTPPGVAWPQADLVMTPIPEPSIFTVFALGAATMWFMRKALFSSHFPRLR